MANLHRHSVRILALAAILLLVYGCADRDRNNPLDPKNPNTRGKPSGLRVVSVQDTVSLRWDALALDDLTAYKVYRRTLPATEFAMVGTVPAPGTSFEDPGLVFDTEYEYEISAVAGGVESSLSDSVRIRPGPTFSYAANNASRSLLRLTHDSRHLVRRTIGFLNIFDLQPNGVTGEVWVIDLFSLLSGDILRVTPAGDIQPGAVQLRGPRSLDIDPRNGDVWVVDVRDSLVVKFDKDGSKLFEADNLGLPVAVSVDPANGDCWVADFSGGRAIRLSADGSDRLISGENFSAIRALAVSPTDGAVWASDSARVVKMDAAGTRVLQVTGIFTEAHKLAVFPADGAVWAINWDPSFLVKLDSSGTELFRIGQLARPEDLALNFFDGSCLLADTDNDRLLRISKDGKTVEVVQQIQVPLAVGIAN